MNNYQISGTLIVFLGLIIIFLGIRRSIIQSRIKVIKIELLSGSMDFGETGKYRIVIEQCGQLKDVIIYSGQREYVNSGQRVFYNEDGTARGNHEQISMAVDGWTRSQQLKNTTLNSR